VCMPPSRASPLDILYVTPVMLSPFFFKEILFFSRTAFQDPPPFFPGAVPFSLIKFFSLWIRILRTNVTFSLLPRTSSFRVFLMTPPIGSFFPLAELHHAKAKPLPPQLLLNHAPRTPPPLYPHFFLLMRIQSFGQSTGPFFPRRFLLRLKAFFCRKFLYERRIYSLREGVEDPPSPPSRRQKPITPLRRISPSPPRPSPPRFAIGGKLSFFSPLFQHDPPPANLSCLPDICFFSAHPFFPSD